MFEKQKQRYRGGTPLRVLIVDDCGAAVDFLAMIFRRRGYQVFEAFDGEEGLEMFQTLLPDFALVNFSMPRMNGIEMLKKLRLDERTNDFKAVITSATPHMAALALEAGAKGVLSCPFSISDIVSIVEESLEK